MLLQEFLPEAKGKDTRVFIVGGQCVAAMQREAPQGEFRSNLHLGGTAVSINLSKQDQEIALAACKAHGLHIAGVDIIHSNRGKPHIRSQLVTWSRRNRKSHQKQCCQINYSIHRKE